MQNRFGLLETDMLAITEVLRQFPHVEQAYIFGSRAKGNFHPGSDVDIALKGAKLTSREVTRISYLLNEETNMPYQFDVLSYPTLTTSALVEHIDRAGVLFYEQPEQGRGNLIACNKR